MCLFFIFLCVIYKRHFPKEILTLWQRLLNIIDAFFPGFSLFWQVWGLKVERTGLEMMSPACSIALWVIWWWSPRYCRYSSRFDHGIGSKWRSPEITKIQFPLIGPNVYRAEEFPVYGSWWSTRLPRNESVSGCQTLLPLKPSNSKPKCDTLLYF